MVRVPGSSETRDFTASPKKIKMIQVKIEHKTEKLLEE